MNCSNNIQESDRAGFACRCDKHEFPPALQIGAGLSRLPRQIATFPEFRLEMLRLLREKAPLTYWQARQEGDLGLMLLEMWAYLADVLSFYDEIIAQEIYLRTAQLRPSVRKLVGLLGYLPVPAVSARVKLAAFAEGWQPVKLPAGTAFRSEAFENNPPQIFELEQDAMIDPLANRWAIEPPQSAYIHESNPSYLLLGKQYTAIKPDMPFLLIDEGISLTFSGINITDAYHTLFENDKRTNGLRQSLNDDIAAINFANTNQTQGLALKDVISFTGKDGISYTKINFKDNAKLLSGTKIANLKLEQATQSANLWKPENSDTQVTKNAKLIEDVVTLDGHYRQIKQDDFVLFQKGLEFRWFKIKYVKENMEPAPDNTININGTQFKIPGLPIPTTILTLDREINHDSRKAPDASRWITHIAPQITAYFGFNPVGLIANEHKTTLSNGDILQISSQIELPAKQPAAGEFFLADKKQRSVKVEGRLDGSSTLSDAYLGPTLTLPVEVYGNVILASRGEQVSGEILGSGNASLANQTFKLQKKPLTYLPSPTSGNDSGVKNTLIVYVNNIRWTEVRSFFGKQESDQVYIVRQNDEGESFVTFGDGLRGSRLPTGQGNVAAHYRFGAGRSSPPAGGITQIARPVKGLQSIKSPMPAEGGRDAEGANEMRSYAPQSALILGRAVSMQDMEAVVHAYPGVRAVQTQWRWSKAQQQAAAHIWYIGDQSISTFISQHLRNICDPNTPFQVEVAKPYTGIPEKSLLAVEVQVDPKYLEEDVKVQLRKALMNPASGLLSPERIGIGRPLFRSEIFAAALQVEGVMAVSGIFWEGNTFSGYAKSPGAGCYFDFEQNQALEI